MAPIITQPRSTENTAAPSYTRRALTSQNDVPLAIGLTVSFVCFVVILGAVWCLWRRKRRLRATHAEFGSAAIDGSSTPVEICSDATETVYKYESDSPSYYPSLQLAPLQELDTGRPGNDITPFVESSSVSNSLLRYTSPNGESPSTSEQTSRFRKDYDFTEPDRRSHPSNIGFDLVSIGSSRQPRKQDTNVRIEFVNPREVENRANRILQPEEYAIFLSLSSPNARSRPASIHDRPLHYLEMNASNTDITDKGSPKASPGPLPNPSPVPRISTPRRKLTNARGLQELHPLSIINQTSVSSYDCEETTQNERKRANQRIDTVSTSSSSSPHTQYTATPPSHSNKCSPSSATMTTTTSPASSTTPSSSSSSPATTGTQSPTSPFTDPSTPTYKCPSCRQTFRTPGLRRNHHNRRHNLRYTCIICDAHFGLRADLDRHQFTRHPDHFRAADRFWCTIIGCENPGKEWNRKDNFERHVRRCEVRAAKRKGKERVI